MTENYDALVLGAGQAGGPLAGALAKAGWKVAIIEKTHVGGTCINEGCTPTKTMVASARIAHLAKRAADYGVSTGEVTVHLEKVRERKRNIVNSWRDGSQSRLESTGAKLVFGAARFIDTHTVEVALNEGGTRTFQAEKIFINTGTRNHVPDLSGLEYVPFLDSTSIMELADVPKHLVILGGGYIALEFGQMFRRFGSEVIVLEQGSRLVTREDPDVSEALTQILKDEGINFVFNAKAQAVKSEGSGVRLEVATPEGQRVVQGSHLLVAVGRKPNTDALNLTAAGIASDERGFIKVDETLQTNVPGVYALGDVKGGPAFTHISYDDYRIIRDALLHGSNRTTQGRLVPYTMFTDPQLGRVGLSETEARGQGLEVNVYKLPMSHVARAIETDETRGFMKAVVDIKTYQILGATVLGVEGGELMTVLQMAMLGKVTATDIKNGVFAHPLLSESLNNLFA